MRCCASAVRSTTGHSSESSLTTWPPTRPRGRHPKQIGNAPVLPARVYRGEESTLLWKPPVYRTVWAILTNPLYAGAYAYGQREVRTQMVDGRARKSKGHRKPRATWRVLLRDHHPGYVDWAQYERIQALM